MFIKLHAHWRKAINILVILSIGLYLNSALAEAEESLITNENRLVDFQGFILMAYFNGKYIEAKRLSPDGTIYGYGWLDNNRVFVAYQNPNTAEAVSDFDIVNLKTSTSITLDGIGAVGESNFDVNKTTGRIIFSHNNNINELVISEDSKSYEIIALHKFKEFDYCWAIFWVNNETVGCQLIHNNKIDFRKYSVPNKSYN